MESWTSELLITELWTTELKITDLLDNWSFVFLNFWTYELLFK